MDSAKDTAECVGDAKLNQVDSETCSTLPFIQAVNPEMVVVMAGNHRAIASPLPPLTNDPECYFSQSPLEVARRPFGICRKDGAVPFVTSVLPHNQTDRFFTKTPLLSITCVLYRRSSVAWNGLCGSGTRTEDLRRPSDNHFSISKEQAPCPG